MVFLDADCAERNQPEISRINADFFLPAGADLTAAFSIPVSVKPAASVRWAIRDGPHKNMQAGKRGILY